MKKLFLLTLLLGFSFSLFSQAPSESDAVMLQGFYWDSNSTTSWNKLYYISGDLSGNFDIVWLPPSAFSSGGTGYMPKHWSNQNSAWGTKVELVRLIQALKSNGTRAMADIVVNHRDTKSTWIDFYEDDFGTYGKFQFTPKHITSNDEAVFKGHLSASEAGAPDTGDNFDGTRDLDHTNTYVQDAVKAYMKWMKNEMDYDGWRYDMVKGFSGWYIDGYNAAGGAYISVGEYWDGDYDAVMGWINATNKTSTAFDFPGKYAALNRGLQVNNYGAMAWSDGTHLRPAGLVHSANSNRYAVTFVDNHDTYRDGSKYTGDVLKANAFILSSPGIPCVFYPHWRDNKDAINSMIKARKSVGLHNQSDVKVQNTSGYYKAYSVGKCGSMLTYIGNSESDWASDAPVGGGWVKAASGTGWAMYTNITDTSCGDLHQQGIENGVNPTPPTSFTSITITAVVPAAWTTPKIHVWNKGVTGSPRITTAAWPGDLMTKVEGNKFTITLSGFASTSEVGIVINNGATTGALQTIDLSATKSPSCWIVSTTPTVGAKYGATESADCFSDTSVRNVKKSRFTLFPNPTNDFIIVNHENSLVENVRIYNISGKEVINLRSVNVGKNTKIDVSELTPGVYFVKIGNEPVKFVKN
ncbi:MAG: T9SS type A sorting domain-containing protein [Porphyromonadaceae bacterium]|nr:T9SS type A sorting domain-containing protein [Porphyromonadaceae bacterium]